jgi:hypothetical protein
LAKVGRAQKTIGLSWLVYSWVSLSFGGELVRLGVS